MSAVGPNGTDRDEFASQWDGVWSHWDARNFIRTLLGTVSLPSHAVEFPWNALTEKSAFRMSRKILLLDFASHRTNVAEVCFLVIVITSLELPT
jgi:hypothetical protein